MAQTGGSTRALLGSELLSHGHATIAVVLFLISMSPLMFKIFNFHYFFIKINLYIMTSLKIAL
jgi:hypothetical protein